MSDFIVPPQKGEEERYRQELCRLVNRLLAAEITAGAHIVDADGTLADITTKFNTLLSQLETQGILNTS